jgi:osmotically-inducible protein OsmY
VPRNAAAAVSAAANRASASASGLRLRISVGAEATVAAKSGLRSDGWASERISRTLYAPPSFTISKITVSSSPDGYVTVNAAIRSRSAGTMVCNSHRAPSRGPTRASIAGDPRLR